VELHPEAQKVISERLDGGEGWLPVGRSPAVKIGFEHPVRRALFWLSVQVVPVVPVVEDSCASSTAPRSLTLMAGTG